MRQEFSTEVRRAILAVAEDAVRERVAAPRREPPDDAAVLLSEQTSSEIEGVFVTIRVEGRLRGCIGFLELRSPFVETLRQAAQRAATEDPRFPAIEREEVDNMVIDVTLLGPQVAIDDPMDFRLGTHGLVIEAPGRRGLLLPQVPVEHEWNKLQFLEALAEKAYLPRDGWKNAENRLYRFEGIMIKGSNQE